VYVVKKLLKIKDKKENCRIAEKGGRPHCQWSKNKTDDWFSISTTTAKRVPEYSE
jgi:hypothetical protein